MNSTRSVVLLGKGTLACRVAEWFATSEDFDLRLIIPVVPEPQWTESLGEWAQRHRVPVVASGRFTDVPDDLRIDLAMSVFYNRIITAPFIERCGRILNLHNGPLPRYRGVAPINWALKNGEQSHGVTI